MSRAHLFVSYAHKDVIWRDRLRLHLGALENKGLVSIFDDKSIRMGDVWEGRLEKEFNAANIIILLLSPNFGSSKFCMQKELPKAIEQHSRGKVHIVPIVCVEHDVAALGITHIQLAPLGELGELTFLYRYGDDYHKPLAQIAQHIRELISCQSDDDRGVPWRSMESLDNTSEPMTEVLPHGFFCCQDEYCLGGLVSLGLGAQQGSTQRLVALDAEVYCFEERVRSGTFAFRIRLHRLRLRLATSGCRIRLGRGLGERDAAIEGGDTVLVHRCTPSMWEVSRADENALDGRVLGDEKLIDLELIQPGSTKVEARVTAFPEDLRIAGIDEASAAGSVTYSQIKLKLIKLILRKSLGREGDEIVLGRCWMVGNSEQIVGVAND